VPEMILNIKGCHNTWLLELQNLQSVIFQQMCKMSLCHHWRTPYSEYLHNC